MSRFAGLSALKSTSQLKSLTVPNSASSKTISISSWQPDPSRPPFEFSASGSFANLKLAAEKLVKEQASAKTDLELANAKLKKLTEHIHVLEVKLQNAFNENSKLKVKQKEDEKLWRGLESKFSSTKTLCDQLNATLLHLATQVQDAEKDKAHIEDKLSKSSAAFENLLGNMKSLSVSLKTTEENLANREKALKELSFEKEEMEKYITDEQNKFTRFAEEKDATIKNLEMSVEDKQLVMESLNSKLEELRIELLSKEDDIKQLSSYKDKLENDRSNLLSSKKEFANKLDMTLGEIKHLEDFVFVLSKKLLELDSQCMTFSDELIQLNEKYDTCLKLVQKESRLASQLAKQKLDELHNNSLRVTSEKEELLLLNQNLKNKICELQNELESAKIHQADEFNLANEKIRKLESEAEILLSNMDEQKALVIKLEEETKSLAETSRLSEEKLQDLMLKFSATETEKREVMEALHSEIRKKEDEIDNLQKEIRKSEQLTDSLQKEIAQLSVTLEEKEQLCVQYKANAMLLENQKTEFQTLLTDVEGKLGEAKKQYDHMLENKQLELSRQIKEISQRTDQAINDFRKKYELEKLESLNLEKEKTDKHIEDMKRQCELQVAKCKEETRDQLIRIQEEHGALVSHIQQDHAKKELEIVSKHKEELIRFQLQAENELRERTTSLKKEHEVQLLALKSQHEDEYRSLQDELDIQRAKEERQRALLQLQWKVMGDNPQEEYEVNSKKDYSMISNKTRNSNSGRRSHNDLVIIHGEEELPYPTATQRPVTRLLKKVGKDNTGNAINMPKPNRKVTHHEYEVETLDGKTVTKRRRKTVMYGREPIKHIRRRTPKVNTPKDVTKRVNEGGHSKPSNIGDLFSEGSLNPYADDPYAF